MKPVINVVSCFLLLLAVLPATSSPLQQGATSVPKAVPPPTAYFPYSVKDDSTKAVKDSTQPKEVPVVIERDTSFMQINTKLKIAAARLKEKTSTLAKYVADNGFNEEFCFMVDMAIPSGKNRFFIYNIQKDSVEQTSLVSHGSGSYYPGCNDLLVFSNTPNSNATSLGKYKIGNAYNGKYGLSYKLYGLDSTNNKAYERAIVLHSDAYIPKAETYPRHIYESAGCPAVSPTFLSDLNKYIKKSTKPILLWIYN